MRIDRRLVCWLVIVLSVACGASTARAQRSAAEERRVQAELIRRLRAVAEYLRAEATHARVAASAIGSGPAMDEAQVAMTASQQRSVLARALARGVPADLAGPRASASGARRQETVAAELGSRAQTVAAYAAQVERMSTELGTASSAEILNALRQMSVPREVAFVMASPGHPDLDRSATSSGAMAAEVARDGLQPFVVGPGSSTTVDYPAVGAVVANDTSLGNVSVCTGTLVAARVVLTAAHCVRFRLVGVFFQHAGFFELQQSPVPHPAFRFPDADLAVLILKEPVLGIVPAPLNDVGPVPRGTRGRIAGFGYRNALTPDGQTIPSSPVLKRTGLKLHASVITDQCAAGLGSARLVCWTFKESGLDGLLGSTCFGDSGGPLFTELGRTWVLAGVTSAGTTCQPEDHAIDVEVFPFVPWIRSHIANSSVPMPGGEIVVADALEPLDNAARYVFEAPYRRFGGGSQELVNGFLIGNGLGLLRVAVSGTPSGAPLRLEVRSGTDSSVSCLRVGDSTVQSCEIRSPASGQWALRVVGAQDQEFQVVATGFRR